ncbi:tRNA pseudouridine synthase D, putative [Plasmodium berghei]|uniref:tRNA pseudouridine synthase D, putative n=2 Tax=Plasmodium berghei TaxID=5821 RepID=A0A509ACT5_PLABA|nr:tRNA pseudouridine synthase D, putative [Plasmodium berghei ANKA]CXH90303.1 tRNA pseudouridine synthase D, putative [Plasmodium berghei]SCL90414.1 tRNA pseudouridine synthase D, putative [Plasmodium berghei]SCM15293.1 tRNA pseudouridine synthase D, putative [Plasmodium berghei]SCM17088.1 tRNA pseudouridine synthase D, putative [Plasmodium berghei]SCN22006.1 tRNA pseudouridine synthase D, putative [Plasmodium berghei]|eukprot:XP_034419868.1 tRNA pseudouridine synthase D, putative [Plasmodium berghei ANKA]
MFFKNNEVKLCLSNRINELSGCYRKILFSILLRHDSSYLLEENVGINIFMSNLLEINKNKCNLNLVIQKKEHKFLPKEELRCIFKYKCEDFHVYEIDKSKKILDIEYIKKFCYEENEAKYSNGLFEPKIGDTTNKFVGVNKYNLKGKSHENAVEQINVQNEEKNNAENLENEEWVNFALYKVNKDTQEAIREISKMSDIEIKDFHYSGFKDKRSVSTQIISTNLRNLKKIIDIKNYYFNKKIKNLLICKIEKCKKKIELGEHNGNRFIVVLRNIQNYEEYLKNRLNNIKKKGFINYFGMQRFGVYSNTFNKGKALISRNYKDYIRHVLDPCIFEKKFFYGNVVKDNITICLKNACDIYHKRGAIFAYKYFTSKAKKLFDRGLVSDNCVADYDNKLKIRNKSMKKSLYSFMTNSEYEAFMLLRNLYIYENNKRQKQRKKKITENREKYSQNEGGNKMDKHKLEEKHNFYENERTCVKGISMETRRFHMHSYSAKIFNMLTSYRLQNFGLNLSYGDYFYSKEICSEKNEVKNQHNYISVIYNPNNAKDTNIYNVVLPVLGYMPNKLSYLTVFKKLYREYAGKNIRLSFLEILLYLMYTLYTDNLFNAQRDIVIDKYFSYLIRDYRSKDNAVHDVIKLWGEGILRNSISIRKTLYIIKKFNSYINSFEYEYGMTCVFRNILVLPKNLYFCFCEYNEPKVKFISDLYKINSGKHSISSKYLENKSIDIYDKETGEAYLNSEKNIHCFDYKKGSCIEERSNRIKKEKVLIYNHNALVLSFNLSSSSYATMLIRELYGKRNELLVHNLIKNCQHYDNMVKQLKESLQWTK